jgi:hypothetical protein
MKSFKYRKSIKIINWGCAFDSILELKYAISIHKEYEFLRSHISIYYDPRTNIPTDYIRANIRRYTPDFLIRHKISKQAFLIEIKPRAFEDNEQLIVRKEIAENYIRWRKYDWTFKIVFDDEIKLSDDEEAQFNRCNKSFRQTQRKLWFKELNDLFDRIVRSPYFRPSEI